MQTIYPVTLPADLPAALRRYDAMAESYAKGGMDYVTIAAESAPLPAPARVAAVDAALAAALRRHTRAGVILTGYCIAYGSQGCPLLLAAVTIAGKPRHLYFCDTRAESAQVVTCR